MFVHVIAAAALVLAAYTPTGAATAGATQAAALGIPAGARHHRDPSAVAEDDATVARFAGADCAAWIDALTPIAVAKGC